MLFPKIITKIFISAKYWPITIIFFVSFIIRLCHLGYHDFWYDEASLASFIQRYWQTWNAPLYWILLNFWAKIFGVSELSLRFPSFIFSFFSIILTFILGKNLFNKRVGIIAGFIAGLSPLHIWYAQEARDYSMALFLGTLSSYFLIKAVNEERLKFWIFFVLISISGFYTDYFYILLFIAQGTYLAFAKRFRLRFKEIICLLLILVSFLPYLPLFLKKLYFIYQGFWVPKPTWHSLRITLENFLLGYNGSASLYIISDILAVIFIIFAVWFGFKNRALRQSLIFCVVLFFIPLICAFFFSKIFFSIYLDRGLMIFSPYYFLILSLGIVYLNRILKVVFFSALIFIMLISDYRYFNNLMFNPLSHHLGTYIKRPIKPTVKFLTENIDPKEDIVAFTNESAFPPVDFYSQKRLRPLYHFFDPMLIDTTWQRPRQETKHRVPFYKVNYIKFKKCWVIASDWARSGELDRNSQSVKAWLDKNLKLEFAREIDGLWIYRYVKREL